MKLSTFGAATAAFALCAAAGAQTTDPAPIGAAVRLGVFLPTNEATSDAAGTGFFAFGADYRLDYRPPSLFKNTVSTVGLSVDYFNRGGYGNIPVLLNYIVKKDQFSFSAGAGVGFGNIDDSADTKFAYQFGIAYDFVTDSTLPVFVEGKFFGSEQSRLNGFGVYVGVRF